MLLSIASAGSFHTTSRRPALTMAHGAESRVFTQQAESDRSAADSDSNAGTSGIIALSHMARISSGSRQVRTSLPT